MSYCWEQLTADPLFQIDCLNAYNCLAADYVLPILFSDRQYTSSLETALSKMAQIKGAEVTST